MKKTFVKITAVLMLAVLLIQVLPSECFAADGQHSYPSLQINVPFVSLGNKRFEWEFPYSDGYFTMPSRDFSLELAQASMGLAVSAFRNDGEDLPNQYETYLGAAGFKSITAFGYDRTPSYDTLAGVLAYKTIGDFTLIAAVPCGQGYQGEWGGNMNVENGERHAGFDSGAKILEAQLDKFIEDNKLGGKLKLWVTGFSRAAAVGNLTAADMSMSGRFDDVFAYLFGVPRTTKKYVFIEGIFNICGKYDPVTTVPLQSWGFERYGLDCFTPAEEMEAEYSSLLKKASDICYQISGSPLRNDPEANYQLHMIIEFVGEMFGSTEEYTEEFQDILVKTMSDKNLDNMLETLLTALSQLKMLDRRQAFSSDVFMDYLSYVISQYTSQEQSHVKNGWWDPNLSLGENLMREHLPLTYIAWLFSDNIEHKLLFGPAFTRMVVIEADADVEILSNGVVIGGADRGGNVLESKGTGSIRAIRNGTKTVLNVPMNDRYTIRIRTYGLTNVVYYDVIRSSHVTYGMSEKINYFVAGEGVYSFDTAFAEPLSDLEVISGLASDIRSAEFEYSTTVMMADEAGRSRHISIKTLLQMIAGAAGITIVLLVACLIIWLIHRGRHKKNGTAYSDLYVIVPHVLLIVMYAVLTQFFTVNLFSIGKARSVFAGVTVFIMFLLALRGTVRNKKAGNVAVSVFLLAITFVNALIYQNSAIVSASVAHTVIYSIAMLALTLLAISTFRSGNKQS